MKTNLNCTVILLSYNSNRVTDICLSRLEKAAAYCEAKLGNKVTMVVVDNGSHDGSAAMIRKKHPRVKLMALKKNVGYAAGNNLAMEKVKTPFILLMNSDTYIKKEDIYKSFVKMQEYPEADVLVSRWTPGDGIFHNYGGYLPTPLRIIQWSFGLESVPVLKKYVHKIYSYNSDFYTREGEMQWCPPCFMLLKQHVYTKTKGFDPKLWFHMVDVEWCYRMREKGFRIHFTPTIQVVHLGGASSKGLDNELLRDNFKGLLHFTRKHFPKNAPTVAFFVRLGLQIRAFFYSLLGKHELSHVYSSISRSIHV